MHHIDAVPAMITMVTYNSYIQVTYNDYAPTDAPHGCSACIAWPHAPGVKCTQTSLIWNCTYLGLLDDWFFNHCHHHTFFAVPALHGHTGCEVYADFMHVFGTAR